MECVSGEVVCELQCGCEKAMGGEEGQLYQAGERKMAGRVAVTLKQKTKFLS